MDAIWIFFLVFFGIFSLKALTSEKQWNLPNAAPQTQKTKRKSLWGWQQQLEAHKVLGGEHFQMFLGILCLFVVFLVYLCLSYDVHNDVPELLAQ